MPRNRYKIILIKEGKFDLKQFNLTLFQIISFFCIFFVFIFLLSFFSSRQMLHWVNKTEIQKHKVDNQLIIDNYEFDKNRIDTLLKQLELIKKQDENLRKLVKLPPIHNDIRKMGFGGVDDEVDDMKELNYLFPENNFNFNNMNDEMNRVERLIKLELLSYEEIDNVINNDKNKILSYPAIYPVKNGDLNLSSNYGYRLDPFSKKYKFHDGHDFSAPTGTNVYSSANGRVIKSQYLGSFGNYIEVDHGNGYITVYGHLSSRKVRRGEKVLRGQKIGEVGNTGRSTAPHLHYEVRYQKKSMDPSLFYFDTFIH